MFYSEKWDQYGEYGDGDLSIEYAESGDYGEFGDSDEIGDSGEYCNSGGGEVNVPSGGVAASHRFQSALFR